MEPNESWIKDSPLQKWQQSSRRADEREGVCQLLSLKLKTSLKADELQVCQRHEFVERKLKYY